MGKKTKIIFKKKIYYGFKELVDLHNEGKKSFFLANVRSVDERYRKWKRKNPGKKINDEIIKKILIPRRASSSVYYKRKYYTPSKVFKILKKKNMTFKGFHRNLKNWKDKNKGKNPTNKQIEGFAKTSLIKTRTGRLVGRTRLIHEEIEKPKIILPRLTEKVNKFIRTNNKKPTKKEIIEMAKPSIVWLKHNNNPQYLNSEKKLISRKQFYDLFKFEKIEFGSWVGRMKKFLLKFKKRPTVKEALFLMKPYGYIDKSHGIIYKFQNKLNKKIYIGFTTQTLNNRLRIHRRSAKEKNLNPLSLHYEIKKFGLKAFSIEIIDEFENLKDLAGAEKKYIEKYKSMAPKGYNLNPGGLGVTLKKIPIVFRGKKYLNYNAIAKDFNMPHARLAGRLQLGWSLADAVDYGYMVQTHSKYRKISPKKSISKLAKENNINSNKVYERLDRGWSLDEALGIKKRERSGGGAYAFIIDNIKFLSGIKASKYLKISEKTFWYRLKNNKLKNVKQLGRISFKSKY